MSVSPTKKRDSNNEIHVKNFKKQLKTRIRIKIFELYFGNAPTMIHIQAESPRQDLFF